MLTEQRYEEILSLLDAKKSITVSEICKRLRISESTARRDINALDQAGRLVRVFGGAVAADLHFESKEPTVEQKMDRNIEEKRRIASFAASLLEPSDFVYLDAGTTTGFMLEAIRDHSVTIVTNGVMHAQRLAARGMHVYLIGGELKGSTEAVVGAQAMNTLRGYHFTKGFFGTNGANRREGLTTPDAEEALIKQTALGQCKCSYVLCDSSKFDQVSSVTFAGFDDVAILTEHCPERYRECKNIIICGKIGEEDEDGSGETDSR